MNTYENYPLDSGAFGYRVYADGVLRIDQYFAPGLSGFVPMTEVAAEAYALADIAAMLLTPAEPLPVP